MEDNVKNVLAENRTENAEEMHQKLESVTLEKPKVRMDFYQTESDVVVSLFLKNLKSDDVTVKFSNESFLVTAKLPDGTQYENEVHLAKKINSESCAFKILSTKIEIKLRKLEGGQWSALEAEKGSKELRPVYPSSSKKKYDWDKVETEIKKQEKEEPDTNGDPFAKIYEMMDDNAKRAMMKSMTESGGTVLSTNWEEVSQKKVEMSPPDCMEFKKWD